MILSVVTRTMGWLCVAIAAGFAAYGWSVDRRLQSFRRPDVSRASYLITPFRWQQRLYRPEASSLIDTVWRSTRRMLAFAIIGMLLIANASR